MENTIAGQPGNENKGPRGIIKDAAVPQRGLGEGVEAGGPAEAPIPFNRGTIDIVVRLKDDQYRYFDADEAGGILASTFLTSYGDKAHSVHFGESCHYLRNGKLTAAVHMTRKEFFEVVQP